MALELEGLIARLLLVISCAGEQGLSISEFIDAAELALYLSDNTVSFHNRQDASLQDAVLKLPDHAVGTIWRWLVQRTDISVGPQRNYNHLTFEEALALEAASNDRNSGRRGPEFPYNDIRRNVASTASSVCEDNDIRIYASQETMWEAITGHAVDYKRVPRSEWLLLLGIASTKAEGILQGDLGRLVDQDKRSVPKRTDALVKKGYITKRTTLVRGTKTSKMWLKLFAPPLPKDRSAAAEPEAEMNLSRQVLAINLDAVPWHTRWTGESVDYTALATTIMAICKEWGVLRMLDLKSKLGVLGMRWQMKVVSKVCRFLNARDAIRYVAAKLNNKVFNDCVRFNRELTPKDWSIFLATGKRAGKLAKSGELYNPDGHDGADALFDQFTSSKCLGVAPPWSPDQPLAVAITKSIMACGEAGLTNPDVYGLTLGVSFTRYLSSLTTCISTPNIQPVHLQHLQVRSEHSRAGKVASYRYSLAPLPHTTSWALQLSDSMPIGIEQQEPEQRANARASYGFSRVPYHIGSSRLVNLSQANLSQRRQRGRPRKIRSEHQDDLNGDDSNLHQTLYASNEVHSAEKEGPFHSADSMIVKLCLSQEALRKLMGLRLPVPAAGQEISSPESKQDSTKAAGDNPTGDGGEFLDITTPPAPNLHMPMEFTQPASRGRGRGRGRGRVAREIGNRRQMGSLSNDIAKHKRWKCDECGKTWKNDIGLKYHLEKSQTSCNPSYSPSNTDGFHREMKSTVRSASIGSPLENVTKVPASSAQISHRIAAAATGGEEKGDGEQHDAEATPFKLSPARSKFREDRYSHNILSASPPGHSREFYALNQYSNDPKIPEQRKIPKISSLPRRQITLLRPDMRQSRPVLNLKNRKYHVNQLESLPGAPMESGIDQSGLYSNIMPSLEEVDYLKSQDEYLEPPFVTTAPVSTTEKLKAELGKNQQSHVPVSDISGGGHAKKKKSPRNEVTDYISALLMEMLIQRDGALPGGHSLWRALTTVWNTRYPERLVPKTKDYQWALSRMLKDKLVLEHWHGFQDQTGLFSKCQVITLPHLDAFSAEALAVVENIKLRHPQPFIPVQFRPPSSDGEFGERKDNRRGRRVLAGEVAQLDAPVYAAQVSAKRRLGAMSDTTNPSKRRKFVQDSTKDPDFVSLSTPTHEKYRVKWTSNSWLHNKINASNSNNHIMARTSHRAKIQFLAPNRFLEDDWPVDNSEVSENMTQPLQFPIANATQQGLPAAGAVKFSLAEPVQCILGNNGRWPYLELPFFEEESKNSSFSMCGWMPDIDWFHWSDMVQGLEKRISANEIGRLYCTVDTETAHGKFMKSLMDCVHVELSQAEQFTNAPPLVAGPYNIFVNISAGFENVLSSLDLKWQYHEQLTPQSVNKILNDAGAVTSSDDEDSEFGMDISNLKYSKRPLSTGEASQSKIKRVALITRPLTQISQREIYVADELGETETEDSQIDLLAAFIVVRVLLGGADKAIDWGMLLHIFPNMRLAGLRKFWAAACKEQGPHIKKFTRDVQERLIEAFENHELSMIDFEDPAQYDWQTIIRWATRISRQDGYQIPQTRGLLAKRFSLMANTTGEEDWCERFFHAQSSIFSRFEAVTSEPGALPVEHILDRASDSTNIQSADIARSWIKSLCCTGEAKYSVRKIREKFLTLSREGTEQSSLLLKKAIDQLTVQRVICRSKKTPFGGRPYRLSEWYLSTLSRVAQRSKYEDAAAFKTRMDDMFRKKEPFEISYTLNDGSMMALTNLNATGRIKLVPLDIPNIPFGFEPGNYESRKYPKSYYHFRLQAIPTDLYQYNEGIAVLHAVTQEDLPTITLKGEIPQWIDFFGEKDSRRWSDILGAFCFTYATKGPMAVREVCNSLRPILDEFEAKLIVEWGIKTGVFEVAMGGFSVTVGEWWWLAVPWQYNRQ